jgi:hypothetical protein
MSFRQQLTNSIGLAPRWQVQGLRVVGPCQKFGALEQLHDLARSVVQVMAPAAVDLVGDLRDGQGPEPEVRSVQSARRRSYLDLSRVCAGQLYVSLRGT